MFFFPQRTSWARRSTRLILALINLIFSLSLLIITSCHPPVFAQNTSAYKLYGINFSPYVDGQDPNLGAQVSEEQLRVRMQIVAPYTQWIRTFGSTNGLEKAGLVARSMNLRAAVGAWLGRDLQANEREIANLINAARAGHADLVIVGSEVLLRGDLSEGQLLDYMNRVKQAIPAGIPVTTADVYSQLLAHPAIISQSDVVLANYYPYWEGIKIDVAIGALHNWHQQLTAAAGGKSVWVSETGWPSEGDRIGSAVPSIDNAGFFFLNFVSWARANNVPYLYFSALDESWKARYEGEQGAHWGIFDKVGNLKYGTDVFNGATIPDNWSGNQFVGGPGTPRIEFTYVPPFVDAPPFENLEGQVWHVQPADYKLVTYINVGGLWWIKPYLDRPLTSLQVDGSWSCDITTGGSDNRATRIATYLIPNGYNPPLLTGAATLPAELDLNSAAKSEVARALDLPGITGLVTDARGETLGGIAIVLAGSQTITTHTASSGKYSLINLTAGGSYTITPTSTNFTFNPPSHTFSNLSSNQVGNFTAAPAPRLLTETNTERAIALDSVTMIRDPFPLNTVYNFSADRRTRISLFAVNAELMAGETAAALTARAEDSQQRVYPLTVEHVAVVPNFSWLTQINVQLPDGIGSVPEVRISINLRGSVSNKVFVGIKPSN